MKIKNYPKLLLLPLIALISGCVPGGGNYELAKTPNYSNRALDHAIGMTALDSVGEQNILVVPVTFTNTVQYATESVHNMIEKTFFGESDETGWESVASFYEKSSYGKLKLTGGLQPYFHFDVTTTDVGNFKVDNFQRYGEGYYWDQTHHLIERLYNTYDANFLKDYDKDGDGHVDALWMVYIAPIQALGGDKGTFRDPFWAYKFYWNREASTVKPTPNVYAWASYEFALEGVGYSSDKPDAHTFIHETGHVLGLPDYYDYDSATAPAGSLDMMDHNIIDHNMYSKYRLNWSTPYYVTGNAKIKLKPAESSGEFILIKDGWNGHAYDEYILIEYYTPTGLNEKDSSGNGYVTKGSNSGSKGFTESGVRIWHVDSRVVTYVYDSVTEQLTSSEYSDTIVADDWSYSAIAASNTSSRSVDPKFKLLHLIDAQGQTSKVGNWLKTPTAAGNGALFKSGAKISADNWKQYLQSSVKLNDGTPVGYSIEIGSMNDKSVTISIRKA